MNHLRQNWNDYKCHPGVMPFAGQIKITPGMTPLQFTSSNFSYCLNKVLVEVVKRFMEPILNMNKVILKIFNNVIEAFKIVEKVYDNAFKESRFKLCPKPYLFTYHSRNC